MSRQRRWQIKQRSLGNCRGCGKPSKTDLCGTCRERANTMQRNRYRLKHGIPLDAEPWKVRGNRQQATPTK